MVFDGMHCWKIDDTGLTLPERRIQKLVTALRAIEAHHVKQNDAAGRNKRESATLRICREALAN